MELLENREMAPLTEEQVDAVRDVAELQRLLKEQLTTAAAAAEGEGRNVAVLLKQEPPLLDECEDYAVWRMKFEVWQSGTAMNDKQQAVCIIQGLADDHKYHKKGLQSLMLKTLSKDELKNPTTKKVLEFLDDQLGSTTEEKLFDAYTAFIKSEIRPGEKYEDFVVRFEGEYQTMLQAGSDVKIPGEILALQLILASKLTSSMLISIRAKVKWEGDKIYENTKKAIARICRGEVNKIGNNAQVKLMTDEGALDIRRQDGCLLVDGERYYSLSDAQVLVGEGVPEGRGGPRGRGRGGRRGAGAGGRGGAAGDKKCWSCGKLGHRAANCKDKQGDKEECDYVGENWCTEADEVEPENLDEYVNSRICSKFHEKTIRSTNQRMLWWALAQTGILFLMRAW